MAEVKNAFLKARMNKDLDDRLMPSGEYRNAMNAQVSTAESTDIGALQSVLGNTIENIFADSPVGSSCIGFLVDEAKSNIYLFMTDNEGDESYNVSANNYIYKYNGENAIPLVKGAFLNFHKSYPIFGVNLLEDLLFWTDNRNQPRKIDVTRSLGAYVAEDQISVAKYNPYQAMNVYKESEITPGEYESAMKDVSSRFLPNGGSCTVGATVDSQTEVDIVNLNVPFYPKELTEGMSVKKVSSTGDLVPLTHDGGDLTITLPAQSADPAKVTFATSVDLAEGEELIFNPNPYYISNYPGDPRTNQDNFLRFSYRFKFDDGEYSLMAPFTQICFIPEQDGYFLAQTPSRGDEEQAYESSIVSFMQNKVNEVKLQIPLPAAGSDLSEELHIKEIDILSSESDSVVTKVIETIPIKDLNDLTEDIYEYTYQSKKAYKTLPSLDTTRVYDKIPVKALGQEVISNRVVYANYQDKHTPPAFINYDVASGVKSEFNVYSLSTVSTNTSASETNTEIKLLITQQEADEILVGSLVFIGEHPNIEKRRVVDVYPDNNNSAYQWITVDNEVTVPVVAPILIKAPEDANTTSYKEYPNSSLKSNRNYQVGILLSDKFGRHSSVILSNSKESITIGLERFSGSTLYSPYPKEDTDINSWFGNSLKVLFNDPIGPPVANPNTLEPGIYNGDVTSPGYNPLGWYSYKIVVKQTEQEYYNVYTPGAMKGLPTNAALNKSSSLVVLTNDNINKVPRDLSIVGPLDKKFRSSVRLFGRVENHVNGNRQFYSSSNPFITTAIEELNSIFDVANYDPGTGIVPVTDNLNAYYSFYKSDSNPFIAEISTSQIADIQFGLGNIADSNIYSKINTLAIFETAPVESKLDIFWETSTSGRLEDLNSLIKNDSSGAEDIGSWNTFNFSEDASAISSTRGQSITGVFGFNVIDGFGGVIPKAGSGADVEVQSLTLTSVETREDNPTEVYNVSQHPQFELEDQGDGTYKIFTLRPSLMTPQFNWVYSQNADKEKSYLFYFTVTTINTVSGETFTTEITKQASMRNAVPRFIEETAPHGDATLATSYSVGQSDEVNVVDLFISNGADYEVNSPSVLYNGPYVGLSASIETFDANGSPLTNGLELTQHASHSGGAVPVRLEITKPSNFSTEGDYSSRVTVLDAGLATAVYDFDVELTLDTCICVVVGGDSAFDAGAQYTWTDCNGQYAETTLNAVGNARTLCYLRGTSPPSRVPGTGGNGCFVKFSNISMYDGSYKHIDKLEIGDEIMSIKDGSVVMGVVTNVLTHEVNNTVSMTKLDSGLIGTPTHPILRNSEWIPLELLGSPIEMYIDKYYNLEVDGETDDSEHNYIVEGIVASGLGDNYELNKKYQRQPKHLTTNLR